ncbi:hypothetical protein [Vampirovibrio sp.]|uniref:hypothetical protein n=1 Tax=Vampirovibrio sp. TaxID=2717857 RepID=UPI003593BA23
MIQSNPSSYGAGSGYSNYTSSGALPKNSTTEGNDSTSIDSVSLSAASQALIMADDNLDGIVDKQELAKASFQLLSQESSSGMQGIGSLFATMVMGGQNGSGLFPDVDQDGGISPNELALVARGDEDAETLSVADFSAAFGEAFVASGKAFTLADLEAISLGKPQTATQTPVAADQTEMPACQTPVASQATTAAVAAPAVTQPAATSTMETSTEETSPPAATSQQPGNGDIIKALFSMIAAILPMIEKLMSAPQNGQAVS